MNHLQSPSQFQVPGYWNDTYSIVLKMDRQK